MVFNKAEEGVIGDGPGVICPGGSAIVDVEFPLSDPFANGVFGCSKADGQIVQCVSLMMAGSEL